MTSLTSRGLRGDRRRFTIWLAIGVMLTGVAVSPAASSEETPTDRLWGYIPVAGADIRYTVIVPRDGRQQHPVALTYDGYAAGTAPEGSASQGLAYEELTERLLASGFAVMGASVRGTGCSTGINDVFHPVQAQDGKAIVEWAAAQPWSNGRVGMFGASYGGIMALFTAATRPRGLVSIAPNVPLVDLYRDVAYPGGIHNAEFVASWSAGYRTYGAFEAELAAAQGDSQCLGNYLAHEAANSDHISLVQTRNRPYDDDFYAERSPERTLGDIRVPVFAQVSWQDEQVSPRAVYGLGTLRNHRTWLLLTNGTHAMFTASPQVIDLLHQWLVFTVAEEPNGFDARPRVEVWHESRISDSGPTWTTHYREWPVEVRPLRLHLREGGILSKDAPTASETPDRYGYPLPASSKAGATPFEQIATWKLPVEPGGALAYTTSPLSGDVTVLGPASMDLWLSTTATDADVQVTVTEVRPDGQEQYVQRGWLRFSHRTLDPTMSTELRPYQTHAEIDAKPLVPNTPVLGRIEIQPFGHTFRKGSSIRVWIEAPIGGTGLWGFEIHPAAAINTVHHDSAHPSRLVLGQLPGERAPEPLPACDTVLNQPCRPDPLTAP